MNVAERRHNVLSLFICLLLWLALPLLLVAERRLSLKTNCAHREGVCVSGIDGGVRGDFPMRRPSPPYLFLRNGLNGLDWAVGTEWMDWTGLGFRN